MILALIPANSSPNSVLRCWNPFRTTPVSWGEVLNLLEKGLGCTFA